MPKILTETVDQYVTNLMPDRDEVLTEMEQIAKEQSISIIGPLVGRLLYQMAVMIGARRVFEMGSAIGYSTIWLARAVGPGGKVYYSDGSESNAARARTFLERAGVAERVEVQVGDALDLLRASEGTFDIIFNDVDKQDYPQVFDMAWSRIRQGGLLITDNALWGGRVAEPSDDEWTRAIQEYNKKAYGSDDIWTTIIPLRDGVAISVKQ
ncbi:MAG TPA: O-methyltransferase [Candidatus Latescibacteria bacterium]|jgi:predicted O-methyltransferase YrrM|nr:O-methyltransferase [Candidatus Latescibacterota bacterium]